jgi:hypothetical protein
MVKPLHSRGALSTRLAPPMATISMMMGLRGWLAAYLSGFERPSGIVLPRPAAVVIGTSKRFRFSSIQTSHYELSASSICRARVGTDRPRDKDDRS